MIRVPKNTKQYEQYATTLDPLYNAQLDALKLAADFIRERGLIFYGGIAIDYALRLKGGSIYEDNAIPDYDVLSSRHADDAYDLAEILYKKGFIKARAIRGQFVNIMKVDMGDNHFIVDISYKPPDILTLIPVIDYNGFKCIHPHFQMVDMHSALSFPYANPPREVIFDRWIKDVNRYNLLMDAYPLPNIQIQPQDIQWHSVRANYHKQLPLDGYSGYAIYYLWFKNIFKDQLPPEIIPITFQINDDIIDHQSGIHWIEYSINEHLDDIELTDDIHWTPLINLFNDRWITNNTIYYNIAGWLVGANNLYIKDYANPILVVNIQRLLQYFMARTFIEPPSPKNEEPRKGDPTAMLFYKSLLKMIELLEAANDQNFKEVLPSIHTYGKFNQSGAQRIMLDQYREVLDGITLDKYRTTYVVDQNRPRPIINYAKIEQFQESGRKINQS